MVLMINRQEAGSCEQRPAQGLHSRRTHQLECLMAGAGSLEDTLKRRSTVGVVEARKELSISLEMFKTSWESLSFRPPEESGLIEQNVCQDVLD
jgi:hypothetical protein